MKKISRQVFCAVAQTKECPRCGGKLSTEMKQFENSDDGVIMVDSEGKFLNFRPVMPYFPCTKCGKEVNYKDLNYQPLQL